VVIFYLLPPASGTVSVSPRPDVVAGAGSLNFNAGNSNPLLLSDDWIGGGITEPWYLVSSAAGILVQVTEWSYEPNTDTAQY
jgi:hypothetical protein